MPPQEEVGILSRALAMVDPQQRRRRRKSREKERKEESKRRREGRPFRSQNRNMQRLLIQVDDRE